MIQTCVCVCVFRLRLSRVLSCVPTMTCIGVCSDYDFVVCSDYDSVVCDSCVGVRRLQQSEDL